MLVSYISEELINKIPPNHQQLLKKQFYTDVIDKYHRQAQNMSASNRQKADTMFRFLYDGFVEWFPATADN